MNTKKSAVNIFILLIYQLLSVLAGFIIPKMYIQVYGSMYNGLNAAISQLVALADVFFYGIAATSIQALFKPISCGDFTEIRSIYKLTKHQFRHMGLWYILVMVPVTFLFPFILKEDIPLYIVVSSMIIRILSVLVGYIFLEKYYTLLIALNKTYVITIINSVLILVQCLLQFALLTILVNILIYQCVMLVISLLRMASITIYMRRAYPELRRPWIKKVHISQRKDVLVSEVAGLVINGTDSLVLTTFVGLNSASIYSVYAYVTGGIASIMSSIRQGIFAGLGQTFYENRQKFDKVFDHFETLYYILAFYLFSITIIMFKPFIHLYTSNMDIDYFSKGFPFLFVLMQIAVVLRMPSLILINTAGHFKQVKMFAVWEALINLTVSLVLVQFWGIWGVCIGTIAGALYRTPRLIIYTYRNILQKPLRAYIVKLIKWGGLFVCTVIFSLIADIQINTWGEWMRLGLVAATVLGAAYFIEIRILQRDIFNKEIRG